MRFQRIFWGFLFLFPNAVLAQTESDAALVAQQTKVNSELGSKVSGISKIQKVPEIESSAAKVISVSSAFTESSSKAQTMCLESYSPTINSLLTQNGFTLQSLSTMVRGVSDECSSLGKTFGLVNTALGAFQAQCGTFQAMCQSKATALAAAVTEYLAASEAAAKYYSAMSGMGDATAFANEQASLSHASNANGLKKVSTDAAILCGKYKLQIAQAATAGALGLAELMKTKKCSEQTSSTAGIDCNDKNNAYYNQKNCMCTRNELPVAECQNMTIGNGSGISAPAIALGGEGVSVSGDGTAGELYGTKPTALGANIDGPSGGGLPGAPTGGGSVGASGGGGRAQDGTPTSGRRLNTNILGGGFGGGGGGGGISTGPGYGETDSSLKAYAPGGTKDANRVVASEIAKQVTNPAGRSNWEKVKNRYTDHVRSLTGR